MSETDVGILPLYLHILISAMFLLHSHCFLLLNCSMPCCYGSLLSQEYHISLYSAILFLDQGLFQLSILLVT